MSVCSFSVSSLISRHLLGERETGKKSLVSGQSGMSCGQCDLTVYLGSLYQHLPISPSLSLYIAPSRASNRLCNGYHSFNAPNQLDKSNPQLGADQQTLFTLPSTPQLIRDRSIISIKLVLISQVILTVALNYSNS